MGYSKIVLKIQKKIDKNEITRTKAIKNIIKYKNNFIDYKQTIRQLKRI